MELWNGLGQVATVAQLSGMDARGLIKMIVQAARTVRQNKRTCQQLVQRIQMISELLEQLQHNKEMMQRTEIRRPLDGLQDTLRDACMLVMSWQGSNIIYSFFMAGKQADKFRDVQKIIDSYLQLYSVTCRR